MNTRVAPVMLTHSSATLTAVSETLGSGTLPDTFAASDGVVEAASDEFRSCWAAVHTDLQASIASLSKEVEDASGVYSTTEANVSAEIADHKKPAREFRTNG